MKNEKTRILASVWGEHTAVFFFKALDSFYSLN